MHEEATWPREAYISCIACMVHPILVSISTYSGSELIDEKIALFIINAYQIITLESLSTTFKASMNL